MFNEYLSSFFLRHFPIERRKKLALSFHAGLTHVIFLAHSGVLFRQNDAATRSVRSRIRDQIIIVALNMLVFRHFLSAENMPEILKEDTFRFRWEPPSKPSPTRTRFLSQRVEMMLKVVSNAQVLREIHLGLIMSHFYLFLGPARHELQVTGYAYKYDLYLLVSRRVIFVPERFPPKFHIFRVVQFL